MGALIELEKYKNAEKPALCCYLSSSRVITSCFRRLSRSRFGEVPNRPTKSRSARRVSDCAHREAKPTQG